jgi:hypothetical protein
MINNVKNITVVILTVSSIYLTSQLWFEEISNRNFLYTITKYFKKEDITSSFKDIELVKPTTVVTSFSNNTYNVMYNDIETSVQEQIMANVMKDIFERGIFVKSGTLENKDIYNYNYISYNYNFPIEIDTYAKVLGVKATHLRNINNKFDTIVTYIVEDEPLDLKVLFINSEFNVYYEYRVTDANLRKIINSYITDLQNNSSELTYILENGIYKIKPSHKKLLLPYIQTQNMYAINGEVSFNSAKENLDMFINTRNIKERRRAGAYVFSDNNIVIRYYPNDVVEYSNYNVNLNTHASSLFNEYLIALAFLKNDNTVTNEYFLSSYTESDSNSKTTFYFDYAVNNIKIEMSDELKINTQMNNVIEVIVENGQVITYKKLVYNFIPQKSDFSTHDIAIDKINSNKKFVYMIETKGIVTLN